MNVQRMSEEEFEAADAAIGHLTEFPSIVARISFHQAPEDLSLRAEAVLRLAVRVLDDVGVFTELEAIEALVKEWADTRER